MTHHDYDCRCEACNLWWRGLFITNRERDVIADLESGPLEPEPIPPAGSTGLESPATLPVEIE